MNKLSSKTKKILITIDRKDLLVAYATLFSLHEPIEIYLYCLSDNWDNLSRYLAKKVSLAKVNIIDTPMGSGQTSKDNPLRYKAGYNVDFDLSESPYLEFNGPYYDWAKGGGESEYDSKTNYTKKYSNLPGPAFSDLTKSITDLMAKLFQAEKDDKLFLPSSGIVAKKEYNMIILDDMSEIMKQQDPNEMISFLTTFFATVAKSKRIKTILILSSDLISEKPDIYNSLTQLTDLIINLAKPKLIEKQKKETLHKKLRKELSSKLPELIEKIEKWKQEGFEVDKLANIASNNDPNTMQLGAEYEQNINRLKEFKQRFSTMDTSTFPEQTAAISKLLFNPEKVIELETNIANLEMEIFKYHRDQKKKEVQAQEAPKTKLKTLKPAVSKIPEKPAGEASADTSISTKTAQETSDRVKKIGPMLDKKLREWEQAGYKIDNILKIIDSDPKTVWTTFIYIGDRILMLEEAKEHLGQLDTTGFEHEKEDIMNLILDPEKADLVEKLINSLIEKITQKTQEPEAAPSTPKIEPIAGKRPSLDPSPKRIVLKKNLIQRLPDKKIAPAPSFVVAPVILKKMNEWDRAGYNISSLKEQIEKADEEQLWQAYVNIGEKIFELEQLADEINNIPLEGFEPEAESIKKDLKDINKNEEIRTAINALKQKSSERTKKREEEILQKNESIIKEISEALEGYDLKDFEDDVKKIKDKLKQPALIHEAYKDFKVFQLKIDMISPLNKAMKKKKVIKTVSVE